jgi:hypothetical protein
MMKMCYNIYHIDKLLIPNQITAAFGMMRCVGRHEEKTGLRERAGMSHSAISVGAGSGVAGGRR